MKSIAEEWEIYREACVPKDASETQVKETQQAFYGGASIAFFSSMEMVNSPKSHDDCVEEIAALARELHQFAMQKDKQ